MCFYIFMSLAPDSPIEDLIKSTSTPYHTDRFITQTLKFTPTQLENILRNNYNNAAKRVFDSHFDGNSDDFISISDVTQNLFPDIPTFLSYLTQRTPNHAFPIALSYIISRKLDADSKRQELHEFALAEMRSILELPNMVPDPNFKPQGPDDEAPFVLDHKTLSLKAKIFTHLDSQKQKQTIHNQNIEVKINQLTLRSNPKNPTLIGFGDALPHQRKRLSAPKQILDTIINGTGHSDAIDVKKLMKEDEETLKERLSALREEEEKVLNPKAQSQAQSQSQAKAQSQAQSQSQSKAQSQAQSQSQSQSSNSTSSSNQELNGLNTEAEIIDEAF